MWLFSYLMIINVYILIQKITKPKTLPSNVSNWSIFFLHNDYAEKLFTFQ